MAGTDLVDRLAEHKTLGKAPREELAWLASHGVLRHLAAGDVMVAAGGLVIGGIFDWSRRVTARTRRWREFVQRRD